MSHQLYTLKDALYRIFAIYIVDHYGYVGISSKIKNHFYKNLLYDTLSLMLNVQDTILVTCPQVDKIQILT